MRIHYLFYTGIIGAGALLAQQPMTTSTTTTATTSAVGTLQRRIVSPENLYHHIITVVPFTGKGTYDDPKRPNYQPTAISAANRTGIIGFTYVPSDDGKFAIVEFVAAQKSALNQIYGDSTLTVFQKGKDQKAVIEAFMQKYRKGFSLDHFGVAVR